MSDEVTRPHKFVDAIPHPAPDADANTLNENAKSHPGPAITAEQQRLAEENRQAHNAQGDLRARLIEDGKAQHMGGHSTGRVSDQS